MRFWFWILPDEPTNVNEQQKALLQEVLRNWELDLGVDAPDLVEVHAQNEQLHQRVPLGSALHDVIAGHKPGVTD